MFLCTIFAPQIYIRIITRIIKMKDTRLCIYDNGGWIPCMLIPDFLSMKAHQYTMLASYISYNIHPTVKSFSLLQN